MARWNWATLSGLTLVATVSAGELKPTRIALFNSGVGYFECATEVEGNASADLTFRVDQVNDILKSLVLRDLDGGTVAAVQYPSRDPVEKALKSFGVDITGRPTLAALFDQLRGVKVEVQAATPIAGSIFGVEKRRMILEKGAVVEKDVLTLMTDGGLRSFELDQITGVKIQDTKVDGELQKALATLAQSHDADKKPVTLNFAGAGKRRVRVSYILETPIWKTSYRLQMTKGNKPYLQGWAIVENATEQDWENTNLSLVSGRPISFILDLYQPLYIERPVEQLALYGSILPPEYQAAITAASPVNAAAPASKSRNIFGGGGGGGVRQRQGGLGGGRFLDAEKENTSDGMARAPEEDIQVAENFLRPQRSGVSSLASAQSAGELFEYTIQTPVSLKRQQSAMLPIVTEEVEGQKLSVFNPATHPKHPLNALKLKNTSKLFLMQGPVTVFDGGLYAGDAKLPDLRAGEDRMIAYALDLAVEVDVKQQNQPDEVTQLRIAKGTLHLQRKYVDERTYIVKNKGDTPRTVILEQPMADSWTLKEPKEPYERTTSMTRFKLDVPPGETKSLPVRFESIRSDQTLLGNMTSDTILAYTSMKAASPTMVKALGRVIDLRLALDETRREIARANGEIETVGQEQARIRENMKVLDRTSDVYRRYEKKFGEQETQVETLRAKLVELRRTEEQRRRALDDFLLSLNVE